MNMPGLLHSRELLPGPRSSWQALRRHHRCSQDCNHHPPTYQDPSLFLSTKYSTSRHCSFSIHFLTFVLCASLIVFHSSRSCCSDGAVVLCRLLCGCPTASIHSSEEHLYPFRTVFYGVAVGAIEIFDVSATIVWRSAGCSARVELRDIVVQTYFCQMPRNCEGHCRQPRG